MEGSGVEFACRLQEELCEYKRFCGDLLVDLIQGKHNMHVRHSTGQDDVFDAIWDEIDKLLKKAGTKIEVT